MVKGWGWCCQVAYIPCLWRRLARKGTQARKVRKTRGVSWRFLSCAFLPSFDTLTSWKQHQRRAGQISLESCMLLTCCCSQQSGYPNSPEMLLWTSFRLFVWSKPAVFKLHFFPLPILKANYQTMSLFKAGLPSCQHITKTQQDRNSFSSRPQGHSSAQIWPKSLPSISTQLQRWSE